MSNYLPAFENFLNGSSYIYVPVTANEPEVVCKILSYMGYEVEATKRWGQLGLTEGTLTINASPVDNKKPAIILYPGDYLVYRPDTDEVRGVSWSIFHKEFVGTDRETFEYFAN